VATAAFVAVYLGTSLSVAPQTMHQQRRSPNPQYNLNEDRRTERHAQR
jgi:hypothetical protein